MDQARLGELKVVAAIVRAVLLVAIGGASSFAQTSGCQSTWIPTFGGLPGVDGLVHFFEALDDGSGPALYAGGDFDVVAGQHALRIAKWDGVSWSALGSGFNNVAYAAEVFDAGTGPRLFVGGAFTAAGGVSANRIAAWDGASWSALGLGTSAQVYDLLVFDDGQGGGPALYACGNFLQAGGASAGGIARWNGLAWSTVGSTFVFDNLPTSMVAYDDGSGLALYVAGWFTNAAGTPASHVAKWNGTVWSAVGAGTNGVNGDVYDLEIHDDGGGAGAALYACGAFNSAGGLAASRIAKWDGTAWSALGAGLNASVREMTTFDDGSGSALYVAGLFTTAGGAPAQYVAKWSAGAWSALPAEVNDDATALGVFDDGVVPKLFVSGDFNRAGTSAVDSAAVWDGAAWSTIDASGVSQAVLAVESFDDGSGEALYVGGLFGSVAGASHKRVVRWDGATWSAMGAGFTSGAVYDFETFDDGSGNGVELYAGGSFANSGGVPTSRVAKWNGTSWVEVGGGANHTVYALTVYDTGSGAKLYAGGSFATAGAVSASKVARWNGTAWAALGSGIDYGYVRTLVGHDDGTGPAIYAGGQFDTAALGLAHGVRRWNGSSWTDVGQGLITEVHRLVVFDNADGLGTLLFAALGDPPYIVRWNGASWVQAGTGITNKVFALDTYDDGGGPKLYAGTFEFDGPGSNIYRLEGATWVPLGSGMNDSPSQFAGFDDGSGKALIVGGAFSSMFDSGDSYLARWRCAYASHVRSYCTAGTTSNGCVPVIAGIGTPSAGATPGFTISIASVEGDRSGILFYGVAGASAAQWTALSTSYLCVKSPVQRLGTQSSGGTSGACDGVLSEDWSAYTASHPGALGQPFFAGDTVWAQGWFRDPPAPKTTNLSDGLEFTLVP